MSQLKSLLSIIAIVTLRCAESAVTSQYRQEPPNLGTDGVLGPSYPSDTEYVRITISPYDLALAVKKAGEVYGNFDDCGLVAAQRGAEMYLDQQQDVGCGIGKLRFPLCASKSGVIPVYVQTAFLSDGAESDNALGSHMFGPIQFPHGIVDANAAIHVFRIQNPTILQFDDFFIPLRALKAPGFDEDFRVVLQDEGDPIYVPASIVVDPACYTKSTCSSQFIDFENKTPPPSQVISDLCGDTIVINQGENLNLLSHTGIGCQFFPDVYPGGECRVNFSGSDALKLTITYVNFVGADQCDGFYVGIITNNNENENTETNLCETSVEEVDTALGSGQIVVRGNSTNNGDKYGFIISLSYA
ncbi:hypothetical protein FHG87_006420 [Trinorchestia longiramus]|nr:hypothetical protein FHG87_006420 [Trinorchestia longiramus]